MNLGVEVADLFAKPNGGARQAKRSLDERIESLYDYGTYQVVRLRDPKDFRQRRPDGQGGWIWDMDGITRVLYHLPEVSASPGPIYVLEGEKDVDNLRAWGFTATCNSGGSNKGTWRPEHSEFLRGKAVIIIADRDDAGRLHARRIAESVYRREAISIKLIEMPGSKDFSEWQQAGHTLEEFKTIVDAATEWDPQAPAEEQKSASFSARKESFALSEFRTHQFADAGPALIEGLLRPKGRIFVVAKPKMMKSYLALALCYDAACGYRSVFGKFALADSVRVLYCQFEDPETMIQERLEKLIHSHNGVAPLDRFFRVFIGRAMNFADTLSRALIEEELEKHKTQLMVLDVMRSIFRGDVNSAQDVAPFLDYLDYLRDRYGVAVMLVHYTAKHGDLSALGSISFEGWHDLRISIGDKRTHKNLVLADVSFEGRGKVPEPFTLYYNEECGDNEAVLGIFGAEQVTEDELEKARRHLSDIWTSKDLREVLEIPYRTAMDKIDSWIRQGLVLGKRIKKGARGLKHFQFAPNDKEPDDR